MFTNFCNFMFIFAMVKGRRNPQIKCTNGNKESLHELSDAANFIISLDSDCKLTTDVLLLSDLSENRHECFIPMILHALDLTKYFSNWNDYSRRAKKRICLFIDATKLYKLKNMKYDICKCDCRNAKVLSKFTWWSYFKKSLWMTLEDKNWFCMEFGGAKKPPRLYEPRAAPIAGYAFAAVLIIPCVILAFRSCYKKYKFKQVAPTNINEDDSWGIRRRNRQSRMPSPVNTTDFSGQTEDKPPSYEEIILKPPPTYTEAISK